MNHYHLGGTQRARLPNETLDWLKPKLSQIGITRIGNVTGLDNIGIFVTTSIRPNSRHLSVSQGKGISLELSKISAIMESVEGYHAELPPPISFQGNYIDLKEFHSVITPTLFANGPFISKNIEHWPLDWVVAEELNSQSTVFIPHILTCLDSTQPRIEYGLFNVTTNGLAAGNTLNEALCHALYEIIERDNLSRLQANFFNLEEIQVNTDSIDDEVNVELINKLKSSLQIIIWDITGPLEVPTFHVAIWNPNDPFSGRVYTGTGTHLQKEIALSRALTEAAQARLTIITGMRDDIFPEYYSSSFATALNTQQTNHNGVKSFKADQTARPASFTDTVDFLKRKLFQSGYTVIYCVNHTKPNIEIPVVQLFVPGLKNDRSRM